MKGWLDPRPKKTPRFKTSWLVKSAKMEDVLDIVQIDDEFILSIGVHTWHTPLLLSKRKSLEWQEASQMADVLSFIFDTPINLLYPKEKSELKRYFNGLPTVLRSKGNRFPSAETLDRFQEHLERVAEVTSEGILGDEFTRVLPIESPGDGFVAALQTPKDSKTLKAVAAYKEALISPTVSGQIVNFWRAIEAIEKDHGKQQAAFEALEKYRFMPVFGTEHFPIRGERRDLRMRKVKISARFQKLAVKHYKDLLSSHGSVKKIAQFLYAERRNPSAHGKEDLLQASLSVTLKSLLLDSHLLRMFARLLIEKSWEDSAKK